MNPSAVAAILRPIREGKRCYCAIEDDEVSTLITIEQNGDGLYTYTRSLGHRYDVVAPVQFETRILRENQLRNLLGELSDDDFTGISYVERELFNEKTRELVDLIYSYLKRGPKVIYVVFKEERYSANETGAMHFNSLFNDREQAQGMVEYLQSKQGAPCYWKEISLTVKAGEIQTEGNVSASDHVDARQILASLLDMDTDRILKSSRHNGSAGVASRGAVGGT